MILPKPFAYDNVSINVSDSEYEAKDKVESVYGIEDEVQSYPNPDPVPLPILGLSGLKKLLRKLGT